jgi:hypothetical protein
VRWWRHGPHNPALKTVTARFPDAVSLNASPTYRFAFCATVSTGSTIRYTMRLTNYDDAVICTCES